MAPPPVDANKVLAARVDTLVKDLETLKGLLERVGKIEKDAPGVSKKIDDLVAEVKQAAKSLEKLEKAAPTVGKLEKAIEKLETLPAQIKALTDRLVKQEKALGETASDLKKQGDTALEKQSKANAALEKQGKELVAALKKQADETLAALEKQAKANEGLKKQSDDNATAIEKQAKASAASLKKQADELATALEKQVKTNASLEKQHKELVAALKKQTDDTTAGLKKEGDARDAALDKQAKTLAVAMKKQADETADALEKQRRAVDALAKQTANIVAVMKEIRTEGKASFAKQDAAMKSLSEKLAKAEDRATAREKRLAALEHKSEKDAAAWKKLQERLDKIEAILFPPPAPITPPEATEQGGYMMAPSRRRGCFGRLFPSKKAICVPCPTLIAPPIATPKLENVAPPVLGEQSRSDNTSDSDPLIRLVSERTRVSPPTRVIVIYRPYGVNSGGLLPGGVTAGDVAAVFARGVQLYQAKEYTEALAQFDSAIRLNGLDPLAWYYKSLTETAIGDAASASKSLERSAELYRQSKARPGRVGSR